MMEALTAEMMLVLGILVGAIILFVTEVVRIDVAAILIMVVVGLTGLVEPDQLFQGFASNAVMSIIAIMIIGASLDRVGVMRKLAELLLKFGGSTERRIIGLISTTVAGISAFMQNIGAAALFLPVTERLAERTNTPVSRLLMPMGFAAILGGTMTLVASSPLILLNDLLASTARNLDMEFEPLGLFAPTPVGLMLVASGILLFALAGKWLIPVRDRDDGAAVMPDVADTYGLDKKVYAFHLPKGHRLIGQCSEEIDAIVGISLAAIMDDSSLRIAPDRSLELEPGMIIGLTGAPEAIQSFQNEYDLAPLTTDPFRILQDHEHAGLAELVVRPKSDAVGMTIGQMRFKSKYGVNILAVYRAGKLLDGRLRDVTMENSDVLVAFATWDKLRKLTDRTCFVAISEIPAESPRKEKEPWALGAFGIALGLVLFTGLQLSLALMVGVVLILLSRTLTPQEAYQSVSWKTVFLLAGLIPLGQAVEITGTAAFIADAVIRASDGLPLWGMQLVIAVLATIFTLTVSNVGATVLLVPLAANVAIGLDADPVQFGLIVALAASNAFLIPTHQVNALLMGPGNYRTVDFLRAGSAMTLVFLIVLIIGINIF